MGIYSGTLQGKKHAENEDHLFIRQLPELDGLLFGVADGIGSHAFGGSVAKWLTNTYLNVGPFSAEGTVHESILNFLNSAHDRFVEEFSDFEEFLHSGCTISVVAIHQNHAMCFWAGDSPIFHASPKHETAKRVTTPHTNQLGELTENFGGDRSLNLTCVEFEVENDDLITIATDGVIVDELMLLDAARSAIINDEFLNNTLEKSTTPPDSDDSTMICYLHDRRITM